MIIYNKEWLLNKRLQIQALLAFKVGVITKEENENVLQSYPVGFYSPNFFIRIGLGVLTFIIILFTNGFFGLLGSTFSSNFSAMLLVTGIFCYAGLEVMVGKQNHYCSGVDDILLYASVLLIVSGVCYNSSFQNNWPNSMNALLYFIVTLMASLRFLDRLTTIGAYVSLFAFVFFCYLQLGTIAKITMPFVIIILSVVTYFFSLIAGKKEKWLHYFDCIAVVKILALITFYTAGNYFIIRELSNSMFQLHLKPTDNITLGWFFWLWTLIVPIVYITNGILKKKRFFIHVGIVLFVASIATIRFYHEILPIEIALLSAGAFLILLGYALLTYLKLPKNNFTAALLNDEMNLTNIEALVAVSIATTNKIPTQQQTEFGGGSGGGAGASGSY